MRYKRGDVLLAYFPFTDGVRYRKRPVVVIQDETIDTGFDQRIVAQITSNLNRIGPTRVPITKDSVSGKAIGVIEDSVVITDKIATLEPSRFEKALGTCPCMDRVDEALSLTLKLSVRPLQ